MTFDPAARRSTVIIEPELMADISRVARERKVSTQTLINVWLRQYVDRLSIPQVVEAQEPGSVGLPSRNSASRHTERCAMQPHEEEPP